MIRLTNFMCVCAHVYTIVFRYHESNHTPGRIYCMHIILLSAYEGISKRRYNTHNATTRHITQIPGNLGGCKSHLDLVEDEKTK